MRRRRLPWIVRFAIAGLASFAGSPAGADNATCAVDGLFPRARVFNVRAFGAKGDGISDDTAAFQRALTEPAPNTQFEARRGVVRIVYVPNGTYRVSGTLAWRTSYERFMVLQGQSREQTIIKLSDNAAGYQDVTQPKAIVSTLRAQADLRDSFRNAIYDLTIDAGRGNPGAVGLDYMTNNTGGLGNVTIRSSDLSGAGAAGLRLTQLAHGPSLIRDVDISGFDAGIEADHDEFNAVLEHIRLTRQRKVGIRNRQFILTIRDLKSDNVVPVIESQGEAAFVQVIEATFVGGVQESAAVQAKEGFLHLRDVEVSGYGVAITGPNATDKSAKVDEFVSAPFRGGGSGTLRLNIKEPPLVACDKPETWRSVEEFGARSNDGGKNTFEGQWTDKGDDGAAIQAAIDSGASTVLLPNGVWQIGRTIHIRGGVRRLSFMHSTLQPTAALARSGEPMFRFEDGTEAAVVVEQFDTDFGDYTGNVIEHASSRTLVLRQIAINLKTPGNALATADGGTGELFVDDFTGNPVMIKRQHAWLRQFNPEGTGKAHLTNDGGTVWVLGMKTEGVAPMVETTNGGKTEVLGALLGSSNYVDPNLPGFKVGDGKVSVVAATGIDPAAQQDLAVSQVVSGKLQTLRSINFPARASQVRYPWSGRYGRSGAIWVFASP